MPACAAVGCQNQSGWKGGQWVTMHRFPLTKPALLKQWVHNIGRKNFKPTEKNRLCSEHFAEDCFEPHMYAKIMNTTPRRRRLKPGAIPTLFAHRKVPKSRPTTASRLERERRKELFQDLVTRQESLGTESAKLSEQSFEHESVASTSTFTGFPLFEEVPTTSTSLVVDVIDVDLSSGSPAKFSSQSVLQNTPMKFTCMYGTPIRTTKDHSYSRHHSRRFVDKGTQTDTCTDTPSKTSAPESLVEETELISSPLSSPEKEIASPLDPDFQPLSESSSSGSDEAELQHPCEMKKFVVFQSALEELLKFCKVCGVAIIEKTWYTTGSMVTYQLSCHNGHSSKWRSQPVVHKQPLGNLLMSGAILTSGLTYGNFNSFASLMNLEFISKDIFNKIQKESLHPAIQDFWEKDRLKAVKEIKKHKGRLTLAGDARCDSPGHTAKYGSYTLMHADGDGKRGTRKIVSMKMVQVSEVKSSNHMELEGLERCLEEVDKDSIKVNVLATDRHNMVNKMMREKRKKINHQYDTWHVAKGIVKKLSAKAKTKSCTQLGRWIQSISNHLWWCCATCKGNEQLLREKWLSLLQHVTNRHQWTGNSCFHKCDHPKVLASDKTKWLKPDSPAFVALQKVVTDKTLLTAMGKLTKFCHTGDLEAYHNSLLKFCPKRLHFHYDAMYARLMLSAIHWNNSSTGLKRDKDGLPLQSVSYSKRRKSYVLRNRYVSKKADSMMPVLRSVVDFHSKKTKLPPMKRPKDLPKNVAKIPKPTKTELKAKYKSRFR